MKTRYLLAAPAFALMFPIATPAAELCVRPNKNGCFDTIQEAVDAAEEGDEIEIRPKANGKAYREAVVVKTPGVTIRGGGKGTTYRSAKSMVEFAG